MLLRSFIFLVTIKDYTVKLLAYQSNSFNINFTYIKTYNVEMS